MDPLMVWCVLVAAVFACMAICVCVIATRWSGQEADSRRRDIERAKLLGDVKDLRDRLESLERAMAGQCSADHAP